jgi:hypothetical protein
MAYFAGEGEADDNSEAGGDPWPGAADRSPERKPKGHESTRCVRICSPEEAGLWRPQTDHGRP